MSLSGRHVVLCSWRDTGNPEGGGAEVFMENVAAGLVAAGARVTVFTAAYPGAAPSETRDGIRYVRRGGKLSVYPIAMLMLLFRRFGRVDVVVDIQNGLPFFTRLVTRKPVLVLVHHVHKEQWPVVYSGLTARAGWWIESRFAPRLYRRCRYVAVSEATRRELADLGVDPNRVTVVHNGSAPAPTGDAGPSPTPVVAVVGRLVPHKQVEHAIDAALTLRGRYPELRLMIVGEGWWDHALRHYAADRVAGDTVVFTGLVDEATKHRIYSEAWLLALPSLKEGWGLVVGEAGSHGTPTVAYRDAGGTTESVRDGVTGVLVDSPAAFTEAVDRLLGDEAERTRLGKAAREMADEMSWGHTQELFSRVVADVIRR